MNRCLSVSTFKRNPSRWPALMGVLALFLLSGPVPAQVADAQRIPPISAKAQRGVLRVTLPPEVLLDGRPARLAPGARIRGRNNLMLVSGVLIGQDLPVRYTLDMLGLVHEVWVLTPAEVAAGTPPLAPRLPY